MMFLLPIVFNWVWNRVNEPSTWAGTAAVIAGTNGAAPSDVMGSLQYIAMGVCGLVGIFMKEKARY